jgi:hypothetical protein
VSIGPEDAIFYIIFLILVIVLYFIYRASIYGCYREYLRYRELKKIKLTKNKFYRITGLYLLFINKNKSLILKLALILTNVQLIFIPMILVMIIYKPWENIFLQETIIFTKIMVQLLISVGILITIHYMVYTRFKKK